ncbi:hypothetical protein PTKU64_63690 [Paraburkholderia terrae]|uniref:Uncharacterized protein n=1 Tax=Paraburkholderia terrae TaxID=311230 RepID=A0ABM7TUC6_9BURK|nr:hypothetical protein PTKU64_63690 [Paraburkholderia terrae]
MRFNAAYHVARNEPFPAKSQSAARWDRKARCPRRERFDLHPVDPWSRGATRPAIPLIGETRAFDGGWRQACPGNHACDCKMRVTVEAPANMPRAFLSTNVVPPRLPPDLIDHCRFYASAKCRPKIRSDSSFM